MLSALERANLFIVPLDDRREWYRYHHLFADVLRARMLSEQPDLVPLLHQRASELVRAPRPGRGCDPARAGRAGLRPRGAPHGTGRVGDPTRPARGLLFGWLKALPDDAVRRSPVLSVFYGCMLMISGDLESVEPRLRRRRTRARRRTHRVGSPVG